MVAILDADKEGYLRYRRIFDSNDRKSGAKLGWSSDNVRGRNHRLNEESDRRDKQEKGNSVKYNKENNITPETVRKEIRALLAETEELEDEISQSREKMILESPEFPRLISELEEQMKIAANNLEFESAARIRDKIKSLLKARKTKG